MKQYFLQFHATRANSNGEVVILEPGFGLVVTGEKLAVDPLGGVEFIRIWDDKNGLVFICNADSVAYVKVLEGNAVHNLSVLKEVPNE